MSQEYNHKHIEIHCKTCKTSTETVYDSFHDETYCTQCGTVLQDNTLPQITLYLKKEQLKEKWLRNLWKKRD